MNGLSLADLATFDPLHKRRKGESDCCCPLCGGGKTISQAHRSLSYSTLTGAWKCHRCGESGKLTDFRETVERTYTSRRERVRQDVAARFALPSITEPELIASDPERAATWKEQMVRLEPLAGTPGSDYLAGRGLPLTFCHAAGVRYSVDWFGVPAVVFPLRDAAGKLIAAQGRAVVPTGERVNKRTFNRPGCSMGIFATAGAWTAPTIVLTEAPIDALSLALCRVPTLALCGKEIGAARSGWMFPCFFGRHVLLAFDADDAGDLAAVKIAGELRTVGALSIKRLKPETAKDWNAALLLHGAEDLRSALSDHLADREELTAITGDDLDTELRVLGAEVDAEILARLAERGAGDDRPESQ